MCGSETQRRNDAANRTRKLAAAASRGQSASRSPRNHMACSSSRQPLRCVLQPLALVRRPRREHQISGLMSHVINLSLGSEQLILLLQGMSGMLIGGFAGVMRSTSPTLFALASGIQWFTLGTAFWGEPRDPIIV